MCFDLSGKSGRDRAESLLRSHAMECKELQGDERLQAAAIRKDGEKKGVPNASSATKASTMFF